MIKYNKEHPRTENIMPYIIFTTDQDDTLSKGNLPWRKDTPITADMEFVNTGLERAYSMGTLSAEATAAGQELEDYNKNIGIAAISILVILTLCGNHLSKTVEKTIINNNNG